MKFNKFFLLSLLALFSVTVIFSSCGKEDINPKEDITLVQNDIDENQITEFVEENIPDLDETDHSEELTITTDDDQMIESRTCNTVAYLSSSSVCWWGPRTLALWIRHYNSSGNYISTTRFDHTNSGCPFKGRSYSAPSNRASSKAFVGYTSNGITNYP